MAEGTFEPIILKDFSGGLVTTREADDLDVNESPDLQNVDFDGRGAFQIRKGYELFGNRTATDGSIKTTYKFRRAIIDDEIPIRQNDAALEYYHTGTSQWETLKFTGTSTATFGFATYTGTTDTVDFMYFCDGVVDLQRWNGGHTILDGALSGGEGTVTVDSTTGFTTTGSIYIGTTSVTYTGKTATTFTGCTGTPAASDDASVSQVADAFAAAAGTKPKGNVMWAWNRQLAVAEKQFVRISDIDDFTTWTGGSADDIGFKNGKVTALRSKDNALLAFTQDSVHAVTYEYTSDLTGNQIRVQDIEDTPNYGAKVFTGVTSADGEIFYVGNDNVIRRLVRSSVSTLLDTGSISENILKTLKDYTLTSAASIFFENKLYFAVRSDQSDINDTVLVYDLKFARRNASGEAWTKFNLYVNNFFVYNSKLHFGSSADPNTYLLFKDANGDDITNDDGAAISWYYKTPQFDFGQPHKRFRSLKFLSRGFISQEAEVTYLADYDYGTESSQELVLDGDDEDWVFSTAAAALGEEVVGEEGAGEDKFNGFFPFTYVENWGTIDFYNQQVKISGQTKDENYKQTRLVMYTEPQDDVLTN